MNLFSSKSDKIRITWKYDTTRLITTADPNFSYLEAAAHAELNKVRDFVTYKNSQAQQTRTDLAALSRYTGRVISPPVRQRIGPDKFSFSPMNKFQGQDWPNLKHDFGVNFPESDDRAAEFRINYEQQSVLDFPAIDPLLNHIVKLGLVREEFQNMLIDMGQTDHDIMNTERNPHPKDKLGRKKKLDFVGAQLETRNEMRYHYQYNFNKIADENGFYLHVRFESQNPYTRDYSAFNQDLVFIFPTSNEERDIWRHVFWNEEYPTAGFPVETTYARELSALNQQKNGFNQQDHELSANFSRMNMSQQGNPPAYVSNVYRE